jgi:hypothetical protein
MRKIFALFLLGALFAGCSSPQTTEENRNIASIATNEGKITEESVTEAPGAIVMTANPTPLMLTPIQVNSPSPKTTPKPSMKSGWETFTSITLGISVDYPLDWTATEQTDGVIFASPQGATIQLKPVKTRSDNNETRIGNQRCTLRTNNFGLAADICVDSASFNYSATFTLPSGSAVQWLALITATRSAGAVFEEMFNSVRLEK